MTRANTLTRLDRLDALASRLKSGDPMILRDIAEEFGVSLRSLSRDIQLLRERGLPIESERGRGGGVRLSSSWGIGRIALNYREAIDLLVSLAITDQMDTPMLMADLSSVRRKLMASFSRDDQHKIKKLRDRIRIGPTASASMLSSYSQPEGVIVERLHHAFLMMKAARIVYRAESGESTRRLIEPHYLILNYPIWYALCWDQLRNDIRTFRCDRINSITVKGVHFILRDYADFELAMEGNDVITP